MAEDQTDWLPENQWRVIPHFPNNEVNLRGDVRYTDTRKVTSPSVAVNKTRFFHMFDEDGNLHLISENVLLVVTWALSLKPEERDARKN